jgi:glycogen operon protein
MRVDGFRFDLASVFTRKSDGSMDLGHPSLIADISFLAARYGVRLIAEAWDIESYLLGRSFPGINWRQWNGKYRDDVRDFVRAVPGCVGALMQRIYGSDDLFPDDLENSYRPFQSVNFITAHDGFSLYDLVSYNLELWLGGRRWRTGRSIGAPSSSSTKLHVRVAALNGTPMLCAGDEFLATGGGNNNPYNQDNEINHLDWDLLSENYDFFRFVQGMIVFRKSHPSIARSLYWREDVTWYGSAGESPDYSRTGHTLAYCLHGMSQNDDDIYVMMNSGPQDVRFQIQDGPFYGWSLVADTSLPSPQDFVEASDRGKLTSRNYTVSSRSVVVLCRARNDVEL